MLGQAYYMLIPEVVGFELTGQLPEGATATDMVLMVVEMLRQAGVVGKFVEYFGSGVSTMTLADRATISNMSPEMGSTCAIFPVDAESLRYLRFSGRNEEQVALVEAYMKEQGLFHTPDSVEAQYTDTLQLDLGSVEPSLAGPKRPHDRVPLTRSKAEFKQVLPSLAPKADGHDADELLAAGAVAVAKNGDNFELNHGSVVIAAITSCTNTSNPSVLVAAVLVAKKEVERGL